MTETLSRLHQNDLFARKGEAEPQSESIEQKSATPAIKAESTKHSTGNEKLSTTKMGSDAPGEQKDPGSLLDIDLKRRTVRETQSHLSKVVSLAPEFQEKQDAAAQTQLTAALPEKPNDLAKAKAVGAENQPPAIAAQSSDAIKIPLKAEASVATISPPPVRNVRSPMIYALAGGCAVLTLVLLTWLIYRPADTVVAQAEPAVAAVPLDEPSRNSGETKAVSTDSNTATVAPTETPAAAPQASFDLVRIEPDGQAVMAGRADPNTALILLDNGQVLGRVTADVAGEWAFVTDQPLNSGDHEFSLLIDSPLGQVSVPAPKTTQGETKSEAIGDDSTENEAINGEATAETPLPDRKPDTEASIPLLEVPGKKPHYEIQLASVETEADAASEMKRLQTRFPDLLAGYEIKLQMLEEAGQAIRVRLRTGDFNQMSDAVAACKLFKSRRQACLVVRN